MFVQTWVYPGHSEESRGTCMHLMSINFSSLLVFIAMQPTLRMVVTKDAESVYNTKHFHNVGDMWPLEQNDMVKCHYHACTCMSHCIYWHLYVISVNAVHGSTLFSDGSGWGCHTAASVYSWSARKQYSVSWGKFPQNQLANNWMSLFLWLH